MFCDVTCTHVMSASSMSYHLHSGHVMPCWLPMLSYSCHATRHISHLLIASPLPLLSHIMLSLLMSCYLWAGHFTSYSGHVSFTHVMSSLLRPTKGQFAPTWQSLWAETAVGLATCGKQTLQWVSVCCGLFFHWFLPLNFQKSFSVTHRRYESLHRYVTRDTHIKKRWACIRNMRIDFWFSWEFPAQNRKSTSGSIGSTFAMKHP